jgi:glutamyl-tRNA synthetase
LEEWSEDMLEASVKAYIEDADIKMGEVAQPLRAALTGTTESPGIFEVLAVLGREEVLGRIGDVLGAA